MPLFQRSVPPGHEFAALLPPRFRPRLPTSGAVRFEPVPNEEQTDDERDQPQEYEKCHPGCSNSPSLVVDWLPRRVHVDAAGDADCQDLTVARDARAAPTQRPVSTPLE